MESRGPTLRHLLRQATGDAAPEESLRALAALRERLDVVEQHQVARALDAGLSFGRIGSALGITRQSAHRRYRDLAGTAAPPAPEEPATGRVLVTSEARTAVRFARLEARALGAPTVGSEHLLLGIIRSGNPGAARVLVDLGATLDAARAQVMPTLVNGDSAPGAASNGGAKGPREGPRGISDYVRAVFEQSLQEALCRGDGYIGVDHLLLACLRDDRGGAAQTLAALGVEAAEVRARLAPEAAG
jgi:hypothetical protein